MFIVYDNGDEVIITTKKKEKAMLKEFFQKGCRQKKDYDRTIFNNGENGILVTASLNID